MQLDVGCGHAKLTRSALAPNCASLVGVDASPAMIKAAKELHIKHPDFRNRCTFHVVDGQKLADSPDVPKDHFDVVFSNAALHWMKQDPTAVAQGVFQALKPGGRFVAEAGGFGNCSECDIANLC